MVESAEAVSESRKCQTDKAARTHTHTDISDLCCESVTETNSFAAPPSLPQSSSSLLPLIRRLKRLFWTFAHVSSCQTCSADHCLIKSFPSGTRILISGRPLTSPFL